MSRLTALMSPARPAAGWLRHAAMALGAAGVLTLLWGLTQGEKPLYLIAPALAILAGCAGLAGVLKMEREALLFLTLSILLFPFRFTELIHINPYVGEQGLNYGFPLSFIDLMVFTGVILAAAGLTELNRHQKITVGLWLVTMVGVLVSILFNVGFYPLAEWGKVALGLLEIGRIFAAYLFVTGLLQMEGTAVRWQYVLGWALGINVVYSFYLFFSRSLIMGGDAVRGVASSGFTPVALGISAALFAVLSYHFAERTGNRLVRLFHYAMVVVGIGGAVLSASVNGIASSGVAYVLLLATWKEITVLFAGAFPLYQILLRASSRFADFTGAMLANLRRVFLFFQVTGGDTLQERLWQWSAGLDAFLDRPVAGWGFGRAEKLNVPLTDGSSFTYVHFHNWVFQFAPQGGLLVVIPFLGLYVYNLLLALSYRWRGTSPGYRIAAFGVAAMLISFLGDAHFYTTKTAFLTGALLAWLNWEAGGEREPVTDSEA